MSTLLICIVAVAAIVASGIFTTRKLDELNLTR
jgi:hypothetical protein